VTMTRREIPTIAGFGTGQGRPLESARVLLGYYGELQNIVTVSPDG